MAEKISKTGDTLDEALGYAAEEFGVEIDLIGYEIVSPEDAALVEIRAWVEEADDVDEDDEPEITDEELDKIADTAIAFLRDVLSYFGAENAEIDEYEGDEGEIILDIVGDDLAILIGRYGKTLGALQQLTTSIVNRKLGYKYPVVVDVEGYKNRRRSKIEQIAITSAERAIKRHGEVRLHPMTPYERRIVHITLRDNVKVETFSEGEGSNRRVVIKAL